MARAQPSAPSMAAGAACQPASAKRAACSPCRAALPTPRFFPRRWQVLDDAAGKTGGETYGVARALSVQPQQAGAAGGGPHHARGGGDVPAAVVMPGRDAQADAAGDLAAEQEGVQHGGAGQAALLGQRQQRREDRGCGMDHRRQMGVVIIQQVRGDGVDEGGGHRVGARGLSDHGGDGRAGGRQHDAERGAHRGVLRHAHGAAEMVEQRAPGRVQQGGGGLGKAGHEGAKGLGRAHAPCSTSPVRPPPTAPSETA